MRLVRAGLVFATAVATLAAPVRAEDIRLAPSNEDSWILDYAEQKCRLARYFGEEDDRYLVMFDQMQPGTGVTLTVAGNEMRHYGDRGDVELDMSPIFSGRNLRPDAVNLGDFRSTVLLTGLKIASEEEPRPEQASYDVDGLPQIDVGGLRKDGALTFRRRGSSITFELPKLAAALSALNQCSRDLVRSWGLDVESHDTMSRKAEPINFREIADRIIRRYPFRARRQGEQASLALRIIVNADGSIADCQINDITVTRYLHSPACDEFGNRAMFVPAEDAEGQPMNSYYALTINYRMN